MNPNERTPPLTLRNYLGYASGDAAAEEPVVDADEIDGALLERLASEATADPQ